MTTIQTIQRLLKVKADDIWGPKSQAALLKAISTIKKQIQRLLEVADDGIWGPISQAALLNLLPRQERMATEFSSFADHADVAAFQKCKRTGKSDLACFRVGDNGIGQFGKITAQDHTPMVALHKTDMIARWGSVNAAAHRLVELSINGQIIIATVEDRVSAPGRVDCNPAVAKLAKLRPPFLIRGSWRWL